MKKRTVMGHLYLAIASLERATLAAARSDEVTDRQRDRVGFLLRTTEDVVTDLKTKDK